VTGPGKIGRRMVSERDGCGVDATAVPGLIEGCPVPISISLPWSKIIFVGRRGTAPPITGTGAACIDFLFGCSNEPPSKLAA
jgi:hypothetical protein